MKNLLYPAILALSLMSCKEIGPMIDMGQTTLAGDTLYQEASPDVVKGRNVLIEEFTAVRCNNCPLGHSDLKNLENQHGERIVVVGVHSGPLSTPYPNPRYDFRTPESTFIDSYLGGVLLQPSAAINRTRFPAETSLILDRPKWTGYIESELAQNAPVNIYLTSEYDPATRIVKLNMRNRFSQDLTDTLAITVAITESNMVEDQKLPDNSVDTGYTHKHVLRKIITPFSGRTITNYNFPRGTVLVRNFVDTLRSGWVPENCQLVAFIHKTGQVKNVIQAAEVKVK